MVCSPVGITFTFFCSIIVNNPPVFIELLPGYPWLPLEQKGDTDSHFAVQDVCEASENSRGVQSLGHGLSGREYESHYVYCKRVR